MYANQLGIECGRDFLEGMTEGGPTSLRILLNRERSL